MTKKRGRKPLLNEDKLNELISMLSLEMYNHTFLAKVFGVTTNYVAKVKFENKSQIENLKEVDND